MQTSFRIGWDVIPDHVRAFVADVAGAPVVDAVNQPGGYSPSLAARCLLDDGRRVFVKASSEPATGNGFVQTMLRNEATLCRRWPADFPAPQLLGVHDDGEWVALVFEDVAGHTPHQPWREDEVDRVLALLDALPTPPDLPLHGGPERFASTFGAFTELAAARPRPDDLDPWTAAHLDELASIESRWRDAVVGDALVHGDVRADNLLLADDGRALLVDWAHAALGAPWLDTVFLAPSTELAGGPSCAELVGRSQRARRAAAEDVTTVVVGVLGYFTRAVRLPPPPGVPAVRAFQEAQRQVTLRWVRQRLAD